MDQSEKASKVVIDTTKGPIKVVYAEGQAER